MIHTLRDPSVRRAYVATKLAVFILAAVLTWPLAGLIGPAAWIALGVFGLALLVLTLVVLAAAATAGAGGPDPPGRGDDAPATAEDEGAAEVPETVEIPIEDALDLHPFPPREIPDVVDAYLEAAVEKGIGEVRVIHGRGIGVQRERVRSLLSRHPSVLEYHDAPPGRGGWGATVVRLRGRSGSGGEGTGSPP